MNTPLLTSFRDDLITALHQRLSRASQKEISDAVQAAKKGKVGFFAQIYNGVYQDYAYRTIKKPLSLSEIYDFAKGEETHA